MNLTWKDVCFQIFSCDKLKIKVENFASDSDEKGCSLKGSHGLKCIHTHICVCANGRFLLPDFTDLEVNFVTLITTSNIQSTK
jgi:hypothetical protein